MIAAPGEQRAGIDARDQRRPPQREIDHRLRGAALAQHVKRERDGEQRDEQQRLQRAPRPAHAALHDRDEECRDRHAEQTDAGVVDRVRTMRDLLAQEQRQPDDREQPDGHVDPEYPVPRQRLDDEAAGKRSDDRGEAPHARQPALHARPLLRRVKVADDRRCNRLDRACAEPLQQAERDQRRHRPREAAQRRPDEEDDDAADEHRTATVEIGELAEDENRHRLRQQEAGENPRVVREAAELADDLRQRRRDDRHFHRGHEQREHHAAENDRAPHRCAGRR